MAPSKGQCATSAGDDVQPAHNIPNGPPPATPMGPPVEQGPALHQSFAEGQDSSHGGVDDAIICYPPVWRFAEIQPSAIHLKDRFGSNTAVLPKQVADIIAGDFFAFQSSGSHLEAKPLAYGKDISQVFCTRGVYQYWNGGKGKTAFAEVCVEQRLNTQGCMTSSAMYRKGKGVAKGSSRAMPRPGPYDRPSGNNDLAEE